MPEGKISLEFFLICPCGEITGGTVLKCPRCGRNQRMDAPENFFDRGSASC